MPSTSLTLRAILAVSLLVGFYVLGLALVLGLLAIPWAMWVYADRINVRIVLFTVIPAVAIAWALRPRIDHFYPKEPRLTAAEHPRLFAEIENVGKQVGQELPSEVYLDDQVNAGVTQRGGIMGFGSKRVMFIGLPLLSGLTVSQFRSVLAHEFGHYHGGDTALGPWLYSTRAAIGRALEDLSERDFVRKPFEVYGSLFLRTTHSIGRRQEYAADRLAARHFGAGTHSGALRRIAELGVAHRSFMETEALPLMQAGARTPFTAGFQHFLEQEPVRQGIDRFIEETFRTDVQDAYDTHPPTQARIDALQGMTTDSQIEEDESPAVDLLNDVPGLEFKLLEYRFGYQGTRLQPVTWKDVGQTVVLKQLESQVTRISPALESIKVSDTPSVVKNPTEFVELLRQKTPEKVFASPEKARGRALELLSLALTVTLCHNGWTLEAMPGSPLTLVDSQGRRLLPESAVASLADPNPDLDTWSRMVETAGIGQLELAPSALEAVEIKEKTGQA